MEYTIQQRTSNAKSRYTAYHIPLHGTMTAINEIWTHLRPVLSDLALVAEDDRAMFCGNRCTWCICITMDYDKHAHKKQIAYHCHAVKLVAHSDMHLHDMKEEHVIGIPWLYSIWDPWDLEFFRQKMATIAETSQSSIVLTVIAIAQNNEHNWLNCTSDKALFGISLETNITISWDLCVLSIASQTKRAFPIV